MNVLLDEDTSPGPRAVIGALLAAGGQADIAVSHIRLAALDLSAPELAGVTSCRILLDRLDAHSLSSGGCAVDSRRFHALLDLVAGGRVDIRSAGVAAWVPDFSVYRGLSRESGPGAVCLIGAHYFNTPAATPAWTCVLSDPSAVTLAQRRFDDLWLRGHDVSEAVMSVLRRFAGLDP